MWCYLQQCFHDDDGGVAHLECHCQMQWQIPFRISHHGSLRRGIKQHLHDRRNVFVWLVFDCQMQRRLAVLVCYRGCLWRSFHQCLDYL